MHITLEDVAADYKLGPIRHADVLVHVQAVFRDKALTAVIGHTGSGKTSLLKVLTGLITPTQGRIRVGDIMVDAQDYSASHHKAIRKKMGLVFQYPETQLFAETVEKDIIFGPMNLGVPEQEAKEQARELAIKVGLDPKLLAASPFSLSNGQRRRVAIAGILAMKPDILMLDEPAAGLDPAGRKDILSLIMNWHREHQLTTILVTQDIDEAACYADEMIVMSEGTVVMQADTREVLSDPELLRAYNLESPRVRVLQEKIEYRAGIKLPRVCITIEELASALIEAGLV